VSLFVAASTKCYEIFFGIIAEKTAFLDVMDLETFSGTAILATPSVSLEDRSMQFPV
jgi:hypothetical protein